MINLRVSIALIIATITALISNLKPYIVFIGITVFCLLLFKIYDYGVNEINDS